jgi:RHS repeat-associated protein
VPTGGLVQRVVMRYAHDMLGNRIHQSSMEAGARWTLHDVTGKPIREWDSRGHTILTAYDALRRPVERTVRGSTPESDPRTLDRDVLVDKIEYGEPPSDATPAQEAEAQRLNLRSRVHRHRDCAGVATNARLDANGNPRAAYDFKGNLLHTTRRFVSDYTAIADWRLNPRLDDETFEGTTRYDALNRPIQSIAPHSSVARAKRSVIQPVFNEAGLLERVDVWLQRPAEPTALLDAGADAASPVGVANVDYDAKGQRLRIDYKSGASTSHRYDPLTFRLTHLLTRRDAPAVGGDEPQPPVPGWPGRQVQNLAYTYDPAGNITHIRDDAQQRIFFRNQRVDPSNDFTYDALYRLIQATGREHLGQAAGGRRNPPTAPDGSNGFHTGLDHPGDGLAMGTYTERYVYDAVGNFLQMQHRGTNPAHPGWTRAYDYLEPSLIERGEGGGPLTTSNRLSRTVLAADGAGPPQAEPYEHDAHGNMVRMAHLGGGLPAPNMHWDYKDRLRQTDLGGGGEAFYVYDASGRRVRKVWEKAPGLTEERIYLGGFELFRRHNGPIGETTATLERETLHVLDDDQRIALVETRTLDTAGRDPAPRQLIRYQFGNHLGSASLELDDRGQVLSYEEYAPYGSSTYQAVQAQVGTPKRYRHTGKERDEETGFYYHGARYRASWIGRWTSADPGMLVDGPNLFHVTNNNPLRLVDVDGRQSSSAPRPASAVQPPSPPPPQAAALPEAGVHPDAVIAASEFNSAWEQALRERYGGGNLRESLATYRTRLAEAANKKSFGVAEYKSVYNAFRRIVAADPRLSNAAWEGTQLHHIESKAGGPVPNPETAVDPNNLLFTRGNAGTRGTTHNVAQKGPTPEHPHADEARRQQWAARRPAPAVPESPAPGEPATARPAAPVAEGAGVGLEGAAAPAQGAAPPKPSALRGAGGAVASVLPTVLTEVGRSAVQKRFDEAARLRGTYHGMPTQQQIEEQGAVGWQSTGRLDTNGQPVWEYNPTPAQIRQYWYHFVFNPFSPLKPQGSDAWDGA